MRPAPHIFPFKKTILVLLLAVISISLYRAFILWNLPTELSLHFDEAQYWLWSKTLDWGFYSKPPMLAAVIAFFTHFLGNEPFIIRLPGLIFYPLTSIVIFLLAYKIFNRPRLALLAAIIFISMPGVSLSSLLITTDVVLFLFWSLSCLFLYYALNSGHWIHWLSVGLFAGLGLLTKYSMGIFALSTVILLLSRPSYRHQLLKPSLWTGALLSFLFFLPNLIWNADNNWPSFRHTTELSGGGINGIHLATALRFVSEQLGVFGLISFPIYLIWIAQLIKHPEKRDQKQIFLLVMSATFLFVICLQALKGRAYANWAAPTYAMASIAVAQWIDGKKWLTTLLLASNILLMVLVYHGDSLYSYLKPSATQGPDPAKTIRGWSIFSQEVKQQLNAYPSAAILVADRETAAQSFYQLKDLNPTILYWNPDSSENNHYELKYSLTANQNVHFIIVLKKPITFEIRSRFKHIEALTEFNRPGKYKPIRRYYLYLADDFLGYNNNENAFSTDLR